MWKEKRIYLFDGFAEFMSMEEAPLSCCRNYTLKPNDGDFREHDAYKSFMRMEPATYTVIVYYVNEDGTSDDNNSSIMYACTDLKEKSGTVTMRPCRKSSVREITCEVTDMLDKAMTLKERHNLFSNYIHGQEFASLRKDIENDKLLAIRVPGATRGCLKVDDDMKIVSISMYGGYCGSIYDFAKIPKLLAEYDLLGATVVIPDKEYIGEENEITER